MSNSDPAARIRELEAEVEDLRQRLVRERAARSAMEAGEVDAVVDPAGGDVLLLRAAQAALRASEERYRTIATTSEEGIWTLDTELRTTFANERLATMLGEPVEAMARTSAEDFVPAAVPGTPPALEWLRLGSRGRREVELVRRDGSTLWASVAASPLAKVSGQPAGVLVMVTDITDRRRAEEAREALERRYRLMVEHSADGVALFSADGVFLYVSPVAERILGRPKHDLLGHHAFEHVHPDDVSRLASLAMQQAESPGVLLRFEFRYQVPGDSLVWLEASSINRLDDSGIRAVVTAFRDVTERRRLEEERARAEQELRESRSLLEQSQAVGRIGSWAANREDGTLWWSEETLRIFGFAANEFDGRLGSFYSRVHPEDRAFVQAAADEALATGTSLVLDHRIVRPDGTVRIVHVAARVMGPDPGSPPRLVGVIQDVTESKAAEELLRESEQRYRILFDESPMPMWAFDPESLRIVMANRAAADQYGYTTEELESMSLPGIRPPGVDPESIRELNRTLPRGRLHTGIFKHRTKDGRDLDVDVHLNDVRLHGQDLRLAVLHDVTHRRNLEESLRQAQKMEAVGRLAGGVAHDFNNLLTAILGYADILAARFRVGDPERAEVHEIRRAGERAAALTRQLLAFSRKQVLVPEALDLGDVVRGLSKLLGRLIGEDVTVSIDVQAGAGHVLADPGQMEQVVMNLALNARDAMPRGGEILFEVRNVDLDESWARDHSGVKPGPYVLLAVTDTGTGMPPEVQRQIFDPFFTTKPAGQGTGLGLSTVHGIVNQSGGTIWVYSEPGRGTTFKIYLPRLAKEAPMRKSSGTIPVVVRKGEGTILLVEDEAQLRKLARKLLEINAYTVLEASNGAEALDLAQAHEGPIHLLLTDVVMPGMSGSELAAAFSRSRAGVPVLYMSGYSDGAIAQQGMLEPGAQLIEKPFTAQKLRERIAQALGVG